MCLNVIFMSSATECTAKLRRTTSDESTQVSATVDPTKVQGDVKLCGENPDTDMEIKCVH